MPRKRPVYRRKAKRKGSLIKVLSVLFVLIVLCAGAYWSQDSSPAAMEKADARIGQIEGGKASGKNMDYSDASREAQEAVDAWLRAQGCSITVLDTKDRSTDRRATGGMIYWKVTRSQVVPQKGFSRQALEKQLAKSDGKVMLYRVEKDSLDGKEVQRYDIALSDVLDTENLYMVVYRLYVTKPGTSPALIDKVKTIINRLKPGTVQENPAAVPEETNKNAPAQNHPSQVKGKLAIVIDDFGSRKDVLSDFNGLPVPLTYAVMPYKTYTQTCAESGYNAGRQIIVHMPMQPQKVASSESVYIGTDMGDSKIRATASDIIGQVPHAIGMNNHQGSAATEDSRVMKDVLSVARDKGIFYLDSRTSHNSIGAQTAMAMGVGTASNNLFIDNDPDVASVKSSLRRVGKIALNNGSCIAIGHARPNTAEAIRSMVDELHEEGIDIVFVSQMME